MESARKQFLEGKLTEEEYRKKVCMDTILLLEDYDYFLEGQIGVGSFGVIVELVNTVFKQRVAAKIVMQEYVTESEEKLWPSIEHQNVLRVNDIMHVPETYCYVFYMDKQTGALDKILENTTFVSDVNSFERAKFWLRGICSGVKCLHDQKLAHLDLKLGNVLLSQSDTAKICDFGSLTKTEKAADSYQSPFLYRAPEGLISENGEQAVVDAFKYDIYTIGILSLELFTNQSLTKSFTSDWKDSNPNWTNVMYPRIFDVLEMNKFHSLVKQAFPNAKLERKVVGSIRDFVQGCIRLNPQDRPSIDDVLKHKFIGGPNLLSEKKNDVWVKKASAKKVQFLVSLYIGQAAAFRLPSSTPVALQSEVVQEPNGSFVADGTEERKNKISKREESRESVKPEKVLNEKQNAVTWFSKQKTNLSKVMNRFFPVFRRIKN